MNKNKVMVIGLDAAPPTLIFQRWKKELPNISNLIDHGLSGNLRSCIPPITVPAWMCMMTGKNPGKLGIYGFRERYGKSYTKSIVADSSYIKEKTVWDILGRSGKKVIIMGVPPTYPTKKVNGILISDFLTPSIENAYTYPSLLKNEIKKTVGEYMLDTKFRTDKKVTLIEEIHKMTKIHFKLAKHMLQHYPWDFFMMVEIGTDRIQHAFWKFMDKTHRKYEPGNKFENVILDYYKYIDKEIGEIIKIIPKETKVIIVSDHGAKKMDGVICINEWLIKEKYLVLNKYPAGITALEDTDINWSKTRAFAWGGYYARIFLNVKGRDTKGIIEKKNFIKERNILINKLEKITDEKGKILQNLILPPENIYKIVNGNPSDIFAVFGNLSWRAAATLGHKTIWAFDNDTGPDDAVHDWDGIFHLYDPSNPNKKTGKNLSIYDVAPTILNIFGIKPPKDMEGKICYDN